MRVSPPLSLPTPLHKWAGLRTELLWIYEGMVAPDNRRVVADHTLGYWVWLLKSGTVQVKMDRKTWKVRAGQWIVSPHGPVVVQEFSRDARILSVHFSCQWPTGENLFDGTDAVIMEAKDFPKLYRSAESLRRLAHRHFPRVRLEFSLQAGGLPFFLRLQQLFFQWLLDFYEAMVRKKRFLSQAGDGDGRLLRAAQCLHQAAMNEPFPEKLLRKETGLGRAHLDRLFWKEFGTTTRVYWERLREESATRSLETTRLSIKEIGYRLGFKQASHFTKWFRHRLGTTPSDYRERPAQRLVSGHPLPEPE